MTPQRKQQLEARMQGILDRAIAELVREHIDGNVTAAAVAEQLAELTEIFVCIGTAYSVLRGEKP